MTLVRPEFQESVRARRRELGRCWPDGCRNEFEAHLKEMLGTAVLGTRVPLNALRSILKDGRFKTRHEGSMSKNPDRNIDEETEIWCLDPSRPETYPIFGYAASVDDVTDPLARASLHQAYGSARVLLSGHVRARTTVFFGDSLSWLRNMTGAPAPLGAPDELAWPFDRGNPTERRSLDECGYDEVVELQILGGISVDEIASVVFDFEPATALVSELRAADIGYTVNPMTKLPSWACERFVRDRLYDAVDDEDLASVSAHVGDKPSEPSGRDDA